MTGMRGCEKAIKQGVYRYTSQKVFWAEYPIAALAHEIALGKGQRSGEGGRRHGGNAEETGRRAEERGKEGLGGEVYKNTFNLEKIRKVFTFVENLNQIKCEQN